MPTFNYKGHYLVYFGAFKNHIGFYPAPTGNAEFKEELELYGTGKGTLKFPLNKPIPFAAVNPKSYGVSDQGEFGEGRTGEEVLDLTEVEENDEGQLVRRNPGRPYAAPNRRCTATSPPSTGRTAPVRVYHARGLGRSNRLGNYMAGILTSENTWRNNPYVSLAYIAEFRQSQCMRSASPNGWNYRRWKKLRNPGIRTNPFRPHSGSIPNPATGQSKTSITDYCGSRPGE